MPLSIHVAAGLTAGSLSPLVAALVVDRAGGSLSLALSLAALVAVLHTLFGTLYLSRRLSRPLISVGDAARQVAMGNLLARVSVDAYREAALLGGAFNKMTSDLSSLVTGVEESLSRLREVSTDVAQASHLTAEDASRQSESSGRTIEYLVGVSKTFDSVARESDGVLKRAEETLEAAEAGGSSVEDSNEDMVALAEGVISTGETAQQMADVAFQIGSVTGMMQSIADETKILAVNAAIEAARAGDAGQGFKIVASHIRSLAESVSSSASRISGMVDSIQHATQVMRKTAATQAELATKGVDSSRRAKTTFDEILGHMRATVVAAREIAAATSDQREGAEGLIKAVREMGESTQGTASAAEQLSHSIDRIEAEVNQLEQRLLSFTASREAPLAVSSN